EYEVRSRENECFPVRLDERTCICGRWRYSGIPCAHAFAAITFARLDMIDFVDHRFKIEEFEATYRLGIFAMSTVNLDEAESIPVCAPPNTARPPGRPHKNEFGTRKMNI
ncbi:hypothetical protein V1504DRAFT_366227, partial [Lipomyces starkeyi]